MMSHQEIHELIDAYVDGELDVLASREVQQHLSSCADCRHRQENIVAVRRVVQQNQPGYRAPAHLRRQIGRALRAENRSSSAGVWLLVSAACALVLLAALQFIHTRGIQRDVAANDIVASHIRSLLAAHLVDVASSDQHTVKPWFDGKIDFAPPVQDLTSHGFPLTGGRLDYVNGAPAAALVYQHNKHPINVFVQPKAAESDAPPTTTTRRGYNLIEWSRGGMRYWAISDLNVPELTEFVRLLRQ